MNEQTGRLWVRLISKDAFRHYMEFRGHTVRSLAELVDRETAKAAARNGQHPTKSRSIIGHLRSGLRSTCQPATAHAIEKCLDAPSGSLFVPQVSHVSQVRRAAA